MGNGMLKTIIEKHAEVIAKADEKIHAFGKQYPNGDFRNMDLRHSNFALYEQTLAAEIRPYLAAAIEEVLDLILDDIKSN